MLLLLLMLSGALVLALILVSAVRPAHAPFSLFELRRRQKLGDKKAEAALIREESLARLGMLRVPMQVLLGMAAALLLAYVFGWVIGAVAALVVGLLHAPVARFTLVRRLAGKIFARYEKKLLIIVAQHKGLFRLVGGKTLLKSTHPLPASPEEITHIIESSNVFSGEDTTLLKNALSFRHRFVKNIMTPAEAIISIPYGDLLGPLVLDGLHKTGHTLFPVMKGSTIVGILDSKGHVTVRNQDSVYVRDVMYTDIVKIDQTVSLDDALKVFLKSRQQLLIVTNDEGATAGILTLDDVVRALTGWSER